MMSFTKGIAAASAVVAMMAISTVAQAEAVSPASRLALSAPVGVVPVGARVGAKQSHENKAVSTGVVVGVLAGAAAIGGIVAAASSGNKDKTPVSP